MTRRASSRHPPGDDQFDTVIPTGPNGTWLANEAKALLLHFLLTIFDGLSRDEGIATANPVYEMCYAVP